MDLMPARAAAVSRRGLVVALVGALTATVLGLVLTGSLGALGLSPACGPGGSMMRMADGSRPCVHSDEAPPGVDVHDQVSTAELRSRVGAGPAAYQAAEDAGVATAVASTATSPDVTCDGDGTSGYRTQAMYVVEAGKANRYAAMLPTFQKWAAGVDDVVNRSAALTGGVRHVRYVTDPGAGGTCVADVLNVTVPNGSMTSFNATIQAVQALGYNDANRKYLMWTDATNLCGIATLYTTDGTGQDNPNNGSYAQYARIDSGCWGLGNGTNDHSVEAHELTHTLGAVQNSAPHSTHAGHCWDEADTMCYADGGNHAMVAICPSDREYLLDCNSDDYFSTYPDPGGYLDTHWNAASSRFLIGGGDGTGGGSAGTPTVLGARLAVNNPEVPGLATQVTVAPSLPSGRTLASVRWKSARADCVFGTPTELQSTVTCPATAASPTTVTATLTDSTGATKVVTSPLTFAAGTARPLAAVLSVAGQGGDQVSSASMCTGAGSPVSAVLTDVQTGQPVKGLAASFTRQAAGATTALAAGAGTTDGTGRATVTQTATAPVTYGVRTIASRVYAALAPVTLPATVAKCSPALSAAASATDLYNGDAITVSGTLTRDVAGDQVPVAGSVLPVQLSSTSTVSGRTVTRVATLGSARTAFDGTYSLAVRPTTSGRLTVSLPGSTSYVATSAVVGDLTVRMPATTMDASVDQTDVGYGNPVVVTGSLHRVAGADTTAASGMSVLAKVTPPGRPATTVGSGRTLPDGTFRISVPLRVSGDLTVVFAGTSALPAASRDLGDVTAGTWGTTLTGSPSTTSVTLGQTTTVTGALQRSYGSTAEPAKAVAVRLYARAAGATRDTIYSAATSATGTFTFRLAPRVTTTFTPRVVGVVGYADAAAAPFTVTVH